MDKRQIQISKFLSLILRHQPQLIGLQLDEGGWVDVDELLAAANAHGRSLSYDELLAVVEQNDKQRFALRDGRIRASQGHSIAVDLGLPPQPPPPVLYHGTAVRSLDSIRANGLQNRKRQFVHLSLDPDTARTVGRRHGPAAVLRIDAAALHAAGHKFYLSENGVWLTESVPWAYIEVLDGGSASLAPYGVADDHE